MNRKLRTTIATIVTASVVAMIAVPTGFSASGDNQTERGGRIPNIQHHEDEARHGQEHAQQRPLIGSRRISAVRLPTRFCTSTPPLAVLSDPLEHVIKRCGAYDLGV